MNGYTSDPTSTQNLPCYGCTGYGQTPAAVTQNPNFQGSLPAGLQTAPNYNPTPYTSTYGTPMAQQGAQTTMPQQNQQAGGMPASDLAPITALNQPMPVTTQSLQYINGFLRTQIGKKVTVDFLIGTSTLVDKTGTLLGVGANFILINEIETDDLLICDFYTIKFVKVYY
jgi:hypothetical protein